MNDKKNNRLNNIIKDLKSDNKETVLTAVKQLRKHGKREAILPLIDLLNSSNDEVTNSSIIELLYDLQDQTVVDDIISVIEDDSYDSIKAILISIFWQSKLDASEYLSSLVQQAINCDYLVGIEVMTVIDSMDTTFNEDDVNDLKYDLEDAISSEEDIEKAKLLASIRISLDNLNLEF